MQLYPWPTSDGVSAGCSPDLPGSCLSSPRFLSIWTFVLAQGHPPSVGASGASLFALSFFLTLSWTHRVLCPVTVKFEPHLWAPCYLLHGPWVSPSYIPGGLHWWGSSYIPGGYGGPLPTSTHTWVLLAGRDSSWASPLSPSQLCGFTSSLISPLASVLTAL